MSRFQLAAIALILVLCALDGFDVFAITFAAPAIGREMALGGAAIGLVFAAGLVGMALGSLLLAPAADIYGRRALAILSLVLMAGGTFWTAVAPDVTHLAVSRLFTGFGIGTMIAVVNPLAAEYANARRRDLAVALLNLGFPLGGVIGGLVAARLIPAYGWRSIFVFAGLLAIVMLAIVVAWLPEPISGLLSRPRATTLVRVNAYLARCGQPSLAELPERAARQRRSFALVLGRADVGNTIRVTSIYFLYVVSVFYIQSWVPSLVAAAGHSSAQAAMVSTWMNLSGIAGGLVLSAAVPRFGLKAIIAFAFLLTAVAIVLFGFVAPTLGLLTLMAIVVGFATIGAMVNLYAVVSRSFPAAARASGTGFVIGMGRFGSALGPALAGLFFSLGHGREGVSLVMAIPAVVATVILLAARLRSFD